MNELSISLVWIYTSGTDRAFCSLVYSGYEDYVIHQQEMQQRTLHALDARHRREAHIQKTIENAHSRGNCSALLCCTLSSAARGGMLLITAINTAEN